MDRRKGRTRPLIAFAAAFLCAAAVSRAVVPIRDARWLQSADLAADLTRQPSECRTRYADDKLERSAQIGRVAFSAPMLLGGQAARAGISCSTCHSNGRRNAHFHFPGLSSDPGTADVTSSIMSSHRGDGIFNPKAIPDLAGDPSRRKVSRDPSRDDLRTFIHGLITQEFDGPEPPNAVLEGITAYVRSISPASCRGPGVTPITLSAFLGQVDDAVRLAQHSFATGDGATGRLLLGAARSTLGKVDERFAVPSGTSAREILREASAELGVIEHADHVTQTSIGEWQRKWPARVRQLHRSEPNSLFSEAVLRRALEAN